MKLPVTVRCGGPSSLSHKEPPRVSRYAAASGGSQLRLYQQRVGSLRPSPAIGIQHTVAPSQGPVSSRIRTVQPVVVGKDDFWNSLVDMRRALSRSAFVAIDCEMTGLWAGKQYPRRLDDYHTRYSKLRAATDAFMPVQFGLSCFVNTSSDEWEVRTWNVTVFPDPSTWNPQFSTNAATLEFLSREGFDFSAWVRDGVRFMPLSARFQKAVESELLTAKAQLGLQGSQEEEGDATMDDQASVGEAPTVKAVEGARSSGATAEPTPAQPRQSVRLQRHPKTGELSLSDPPAWDARLKALNGALQVAATCGGLGCGERRLLPEGVDPVLESWPALRRVTTEWLYDAADPSNISQSEARVVLSSELSVRVLEMLIVLDLWQRPDLPSFKVWSQPASSPADTRVGSAPVHTLSLQQVYANSGSDSSTERSGSWEVRLKFKRALSSEVAAVRGQGVQRRQLHEATGASVVLEAIQEYGVPVVVHNGTLDIALLLAHMRGLPLPASWAQYKKLVRNWFPGGVYDTKHISASLPHTASSGARLQDLRLQDLVRHLQPPVSAPSAPAAGDGASVGEDRYLRALQGMSSSPPSADLGTPGVLGDPSTSGSEAESQQPTCAHEAGFDALMTGLAFISLAHLSAPQAAPQSSHLGAHSQHPLVAVVAPSANRLHGRQGAPYYDLSGEADPVPDLTDVLVISGLKPKTRWMEVSNRLRQLNLTQFRVTMHSTQSDVWGAPAAAASTAQPSSARTAQTAHKRRPQVAPTSRAVSPRTDSCLVELLGPGASAEEVVRVLQPKARDWVLTTLADWCRQQSGFHCG